MTGSGWIGRLRWPEPGGRGGEPTERNRSTVAVRVGRAHIEPDRSPSSCGIRRDFDHDRTPFARGDPRPRSAHRRLPLRPAARSVRPGPARRRRVGPARLHGTGRGRRLRRRIGRRGPRPLHSRGRRPPSRDQGRHRPVLRRSRPGRGDRRGAPRTRPRHGPSGPGPRSRRLPRLLRRGRHVLRPRRRVGGDCALAAGARLLPGGRRARLQRELSAARTAVPGDRGQAGGRARRGPRGVRPR